MLLSGREVCDRCRFGDTSNAGNECKRKKCSALYKPTSDGESCKLTESGIAVIVASVLLGTILTAVVAGQVCKRCLCLSRSAEMYDYKQIQGADVQYLEHGGEDMEPVHISKPTGQHQYLKYGGEDMEPVHISMSTGQHQYIEHEGKDIEPVHISKSTIQH